MKRSSLREGGFIAAGAALIATTYGLVRFAYGLYLPDVQSDLGLPASAAGVIAAGASVVYCIAALAAFAGAARRPRSFAAAAGGIAVVGSLGMAISPDAVWFGAWVIASSSAAGLASPALVALVQRGVPPDAQSRAQASVNAGTGPGLIAAGALALLLLPEWRVAWAAAAAATGLAAVLVVVLARGRSATRDHDRTGGLPPTPWFRAHLRVITAAVLLGAGSAAVWTYGRTVLVAAGMTETLSVLAWIALGIGGAAVMLTARAMARMTPSLAWAVTTGLVALSTAALALAPASAPVALVSCAVFGWGYVAGSGALIAWTAALDPARAAAGTAMLFVLLVLGQALGAAAAGALYPLWGFLGVFLLAAAVTVGAAVLGVIPRAARRGAVGVGGDAAV